MPLFNTGEQKLLDSLTDSSTGVTERAEERKSSVTAEARPAEVCSPMREMYTGI